MKRRDKNFAIDVKPRDALLDVRGLSPEATGIFFKFWMLHHLHGEPLPPREEQRPPSEWDEWFRDELDLKNVRSWRRIRDELLTKARLRQAPDGRLYMGRTRRELMAKQRWNGPAEDDENDQRAGMSDPQETVEKPVEVAGMEPEQPDTSADVRANIDRSSPDHRPNRPCKPLITHGIGGVLSYSDSNSNHDQVAAAESGHRARARGDPVPA